MRRRCVLKNNTLGGLTTANSRDYSWRYVMSDTQSVAPGFLTIAKAAQWASVSPRTVRRWMTRGLATYHSGPGTRVLIRPSDIEAFLIREQVPQADLNALVEESFAAQVTEAGPNGPPSNQTHTRR